MRKLLEKKVLNSYFSIVNTIFIYIFILKQLIKLNNRKVYDIIFLIEIWHLWYGSKIA